MSDDLQASTGSGVSSEAADPLAPPPPTVEPAPAGIEPTVAAGGPAGAAPTTFASMDPLAAAGAGIRPEAITPAPTAPVTPTAAPHGPRARWVVAAIAALAIVAVTAAGLFALVGASSSSTVAKWAPADSVVYVEVRGDLPGDQRQNLGRFLSHFPGFADQSILDQKLDETLDRLIGSASSGQQDWSTKIKPWFGGEVGIAVSGLPGVGGTGVETPHSLLIATQKDPAGAMAWVAGLGVAAPSTEVYSGVTLRLSTVGPEQGAYGVTSGVLLAGDVASVKAAIDRAGSDGLATVQGYQTAMAGLKGDQVVRAYEDLRGYLDAVKGSLGPLASAMTTDLATALQRLPTWIAAGLRVEEDALVGTTVLPTPSGAPSVENRASSIAPRLPASTIALAEVHDVGAVITATLDGLRKEPTAADALKSFDQAAGVLGGIDAMTSWIGDVGIAVTADGGRPSGGLVVVAKDPEKAASTLTSVKNLLALASASTGVIVREEAYGSGTITVIDLGDVQKLLGGTAGGAYPLPISGHVEIAVGIGDGIVAIGVGDGFVKSVLDTKPGSSLADQAAYKGAMERVGVKNVSSAYVDIDAVRALAEPFIALSPGGASYTRDARPYLEPFDVLATAAVSGDPVETVTTVIIVSTPSQ